MAALSAFRPYPKSSQLARGERRYRRKVASAKQWQRIIAAKQGPCRVCRDPASNGSVHAHITFHHLVPRAQGGDDCADNIVPLCSDCHGLATLRNPLVLEVLAAHLLDSEYAYIVDKLGESGMERLFGVVRPSGTNIRPSSGDRDEFAAAQGRHVREAARASR